MKTKKNEPHTRKIMLNRTTPVSEPYMLVFKLMTLKLSL